MSKRSTRHDVTDDSVTMSSVLLTYYGGWMNDASDVFMGYDVIGVTGLRRVNEWLQLYSATIIIQ